MKYEIFKTDDYLLVIDDSEIKEGDYRMNIQRGYVKLVDDAAEYYNQRNDVFKKVIAHLPLNNSPILEGVDLLPPFEQDDVEKMAKEDAIEIFGNDFSLASLSHQSQFKRGYNKAKEKYLREIDKQISDFKHDLKECTSNYIKQNCEGAIFGLTRLQQSLSQPKSPITFMFETEYDCCNRYENCKGCDATAEMINLRPKTTTNSQGQTVWVGKYIY